MFEILDKAFRSRLELDCWRCLLDMTGKATLCETDSLLQILSDCERNEF
jgi:hypothetical protein